MFFYLTDERRRAEEVLGGLLSPILGHPVELLRERVLVGSANECVEKLARLQVAGVRKVFLWPMTLRSWRSFTRMFFLSYHSSVPAGEAG